MPNCLARRFARALFGLSGIKPLGDGLLQSGRARSAGCAQARELLRTRALNDDDAFPSHLTTFANASHELARKVAHAFLMKLRELAHERHATRREGLGNGIERRHHTMGTLVKHKRARNRSELSQTTRALPPPFSEESLEEEVVHRKAARHEGARHGTGPGDDLDGQSLVDRRVHESLAGVRDARHGRVAHERHARAARHAGEHALDAARDDVLVAALERNANPKAREQLSVTRVSSHSRTSAPRSVSSTRGEASEGFRWACPRATACRPRRRARPSRPRP